MYSGLSFRKNIDNKNIKKGPTIQVMKNEAKSNFGFSNICRIFEKSTLVSGGYIIKIKPTANGILVVPLENELINPEEFGNRYPIPIPIPMARKIQRVKFWSKKERRFFIVSNRGNGFNNNPILASSKRFESQLFLLLVLGYRRFLLFQSLCIGFYPPLILRLIHHL